MNQILVDLAFNTEWEKKYVEGVRPIAKHECKVSIFEIMTPNWEK